MLSIFKKTPSSDAQKNEPISLRSDFGINAYDRKACKYNAPGYAVFAIDHVIANVSAKHIIPCPDFIDPSIFYGQGADLFCTSAWGLTIAQMTCLKAHELVEKISPDAAEKFRENWRPIRSATLMASLAGYEAFQSTLPRHHFDVPDMIAYGLGLTVFTHGKDIVDGVKEAAITTYNMTNKTIAKACGYRRDLY